MRASIIVPTLNEALCIEKTLKVLLPLPNDIEVIVVDGGSQDGTVEIASQHAQVISSVKGRAMQMNVGAKHAQGRILFFLHADTLLTSSLVGKAVRILEKSSNPCAIFNLLSRSLISID